MSAVVLHKPAANPPRDNLCVLIGQEDIHRGWLLGGYYGQEWFKFNGTTDIEIRATTFDGVNTDWDLVGNVNTWFTSAVTWNGGLLGSDVILYHGGIQPSSYATQQNGESPLHDISADNLYIGSDDVNGAEYGGNIASVILYNRVLTPGEVKHLSDDPYALVRQKIQYVPLSTTPINNPFIFHSTRLLRGGMIGMHGGV